MSSVRNVQARFTVGKDHSCPFFDILQSLYHMDLTLHDTDRTFIDILFPIFCLISLHQGFPSGYGQALRETISAHCYNTDFQFWHILHSMYSPFFFIDICPKPPIHSFLAALNSCGSSPYSHKTTSVLSYPRAPIMAIRPVHKVSSPTQY